ncbi:uncharacterized protein NPIL_522731 [Nephila pilipes]|uniref:Uncharacterized protein n=1 Tax=Nephila pilipes TaxID=299642 RepID=A0A8X6NV79_NEPPI|nr:uncharacterized protein NPIL_522731 [Nephila pilipes]
MQNAGIQLHKWCTNHPELSSSVNGNYNFSNSSETKILRVSRKPMKDCFSFRVKVEFGTSCTKRSVLSTIARLFNPLGLINPIAAKTEIFIQKLWRLNIEHFQLQNIKNGTTFWLC